MNKKGRIIKSLAGFYYIENQGEIERTRARGNFRKRDIKPVVGDFAEYTADEDSEGYILSIEERKNFLVRPPIANIDQAVVVMSAVEPDFSLNLLDRFLVLLEHKYIKPLIYISKLDLLEDTSYFEQVQKDYKKIGYDIFFKPEDLLEHFKDKVTVFMGQTGAGKSTLLNKIAPGLTIETQEISDKLGRGRHTTRHVELFPIAGGWIADTPGFSSIDYEVKDAPDLNEAFIDILHYSHDCKFRECTHTHEPGCAVKLAVEDGDILDSRYQDYLQLLSEVQNKRETYAKNRSKKG
ncbi:ribosome small subunit-dependent GTPase A [Floricoccus tropicus]|uniref:Small ribosomal subunit biogenesis GTPase RsgA n=1 Tax=Floricoccus tropicus TaxID=1859473 RepID=A0A1E8GM90_9LACT|nr:MULTISPECIES: ribosome small subunit-dependent GTPase A [Floricoccus]OFI48753.1 ribosome small subunit-dependent GTPase A [Floricoccus tropicus]URZ87690.1 ribosome small subunit-dependent GTPase A [Floricoccus penangensis]